MADCGATFFKSPTPWYLHPQRDYEYILCYILIASFRVIKWCKFRLVRCAARVRLPYGSPAGVATVRRSIQRGRPWTKMLPLSSYPIKQRSLNLTVCWTDGCGAEFTQLKDLNRHRRSVHEQERYDCPYDALVPCNRIGEHAFRRKNHLRDHRKNVHLGVEKFDEKYGQGTPSSAICSASGQSQGEHKKRPKRAKVRCSKRLQFVSRALTLP